MLSDSHFTLLVLGVAIVLFVSERVPIAMISLGVLVALMFRGVADPRDLGGFSNPALLAVACMFVVSQGLARTGALSFVASRLTVIARGSERRLILFTAIFVAACSGFMNNTPVVAVFVPLMLGVSRSTGIAPSRLLIPVSFASILGGTMSLLGTSTNLLVHDQVQKYGHEDFTELHLFDFFPVGVVLVVVGVTYLCVVGPRMLPHRMGVTTAGANTQEYMTEVVVRPNSRLLQGDLEGLLGAHDRLRLVQVIRGEQIFWPPFRNFELRAADVLLIKGPPKTILGFLDSGVDLAPELRESDGAHLMRTVDTTMAEIVLTPGSRYVGRTISDIGFRKHHQVAVVGIQRRGSHLRGEISGTPLRLGDVLLVHGSREAVEQLRGEDEFLLIEGVDEEVTYRRKAPFALAWAASVVVGAYIDVDLLVPMAMLAILGLVATGCLSTRQAFRAVDWPILVLIAGMLELGGAMQSTGAAQEVADLLIDGAYGARLPEWLLPWVLVSLIYVMTVAMTEFISNNATAVLMTSIAFGTAATLNLSPKPFVFAVAYAASLSFCTPIGYQTNTFVYGPGNYRFFDFFKIGLPLSIVCWLLCTILIPLLFPFQAS